LIFDLHEYPSAVFCSPPGNCSMQFNVHII
jgi:hypothetical protein